ncbi:GNAT family N-acetyltransferase [Pseudomonas taiwanensis]|uniref:GNAT family N-acetyltransferase n=1 Tax=Pseudomonas taiwanensis TaxID=470150 RepID=UPI0015B990B1|nr:GNAT family N-acetyltransferase [Pseudomonas taiwanensis]NWL80663.1 GNAT family N-acetyltransferase [Pseudomonas taiwanensis]
MTPFVETLSTLSAADRQRLIEVWEGAVRATHNFLSEDDIQFFKPLVRDAYLDAVQVACLRDAAGSITGFIGTDGEKVEMLFVDPALRGQGLGRRLMEHALALGARIVDVNEQNPQAVGFYLRLGFVQYDRSPVDGSGKPFPILHLRKG